MKLTVKEKEVLYLRKVECLTQEEVSEKLNYSIRQIQRIQRSAENKIIENYVTNNMAKEKTLN